MKKKIYEIIFESDTRAGKAFDIVLFVAIFLSILTVMLESVVSINLKYSTVIRGFEYFFTIMFTLEYLLRIYCVEKKSRYLFSFFGIIDFLAIIPTWLFIFFIGTKYLAVLRIFRLLRIFRVLKLGRFLGEADSLLRALRASRYKILVFIFVVFTLVVVLGSVMYIVEGPDSGFSSIPRGVYWAVITLTTVGFGDIVPKTVLGQAIASLVMILGYGIIAIPTGIITSETIKESKRSRMCNACQSHGHEKDAVYCKFCGAELE